MAVEEGIETSDKVFYGNEISMFSSETETQSQFSTLGLSEQWDMEFLGGKAEEVILIGGYRGSGKSIICINICSHHLQVGKIAPYCTIEMTAEETYQRFW
jgi:archaellum biogenesis ATPase FlaH